MSGVRSGVASFGILSGTPWRGYPAFVAQHATATCCRGCLRKWPGIPKRRELDAEEKRHVLSAIERWLAGEAGREAS